MIAMEDELLGVPLTRDLPCSLAPAGLTKATAEKAEIEKIGLKVVRIHIVSPDEPLRFFVKFTPGNLSFEARGKLEALGYSVRQKMTDKELCFYVMKSITETKGWAD